MKVVLADGQVCAGNEYGKKERLDRNPASF